MEMVAIGAGSIMLVLYAIFGGIMGVLGLAMYVLTALPVSKMCKRRGIKWPMLAWVPGLYPIAMAQLSDHYHKNAHNKNTKLTLFMCIAYFGAWAFAALECGLAVAMPALSRLDHMFALVGLGLVLLLAGVGLLLCMAGVVLTYIVLFDVFRSAQPKLAILYLLLSIFVPLAWVVCLLIAHKHDKGLPQPEIVE